MHHVSRRGFLQIAAAGAVTSGIGLGRRSLEPAVPGPGSGAAPAWSLQATIIEACSCSMFCPCYFSTIPSAHGHGTMAEHFCRFNMGYRVDRGDFGGARLDGVKFWIAGDLGANFAHGGEWAEVTFEPSATPAQRAAVAAIVPHVYPVTWKSFTLGQDAAIEWTATKDHAEARLGNGRGHVRLRRNPGMTDDPVVIQNLRYFGAPRNTGFVLMPNEVNVYRAGAKPFEFKGTNGFMITYDINEKDVSR